MFFLLFFAFVFSSCVYCGFVSVCFVLFDVCFLCILLVGVAFVSVYVLFVVAFSGVFMSIHLRGVHKQFVHKHLVKVCMFSQINHRVWIYEIVIHLAPRWHEQLREWARRLCPTPLR